MRTFDALRRQGHRLLKQSTISHFFAAVALLASQAAHANTIVVSTLAEPSPVTEAAERVMREAYRRIGMTMEVQRLPGERAMQSANDGLVDGELYRGADIALTFTNLVKIPVVISTVDFVVFAKDKSLPVRAWKDLAPYTVGYKRGIKAIEANLPKVTKSEPVAFTEQAFKKLETGRNDAVVAVRLTGLLALNEQGIKNITILDPPLLSLQLFHFLHVKNQGLADRLTAALQQMEKEGAIKRIQSEIEQATLSRKK